MKIINTFIPHLSQTSLKHTHNCQKLFHTIEGRDKKQRELQDCIDSKKQKQAELHGRIKFVERDLGQMVIDKETNFGKLNGHFK